MYDGSNKFSGSNNNGHSNSGPDGFNGYPVQPEFQSGSENRHHREMFDVNLRLVSTLIKRNRMHILAITLVTAGIFGGIAYLITPVYKSEGSLLITESRTNQLTAGNGISGILASMYGIGMGNTVDNELEILRSRKLSDELAQTLKQERYTESGELYPLLWHDYPNDSTVVSRDTLASRIRDHINFERVSPNSNIISISFESVSPQEAGRVVNLAMSTYSELSTRQNRKAARSAVQFLQDERERVQNRLQRAEKEFRDFMNATDLVNVESQTIALIERISTLEADRQSNLINLSIAGSIIEQYEQRVGEIESGLSEQIAGAAVPTLNRFQYQLAELETERMLIVSKNPGIENREQPPAVLQRLDERIELLKQKIGETVGELTAQSGEHIALAGGGTDGSIMRNITDLHERLIELKADRNRYQVQDEVLNERLAEEKELFDAIPENMIEFARLRRNVEINDQLYRTLAQQSAEMSLLEQTRFGFGRIVDHGNIPREPVKPQPLMLILAGALFGSIFGIGYMSISELLNNKIDRLDKIQKFNLPLLAVIPDMDKYVHRNHAGSDKIMVKGHKVSTRLSVYFDKESRVSEAFRWLLNNTKYSGSGAGKQFRSAVITSFKNGEGKSVIAANLGLALAETGKSVLLMDVDFRKPSLHTLFGLKPYPGIAEAVDRNPDVYDAPLIQQTVANGLDLISAGRAITNPFGILQSRYFTQLIEQMKARYDVVLLKSSPFGIYADSAPLMEHSDGVLLITRFGRTNEDEIKTTLGNLRLIHANIFGIVLSAFDDTTGNIQGSKHAVERSGRRRQPVNV